VDRPSLWSVRALLALVVAVAGAAVAIAVSGADGKPAAPAPPTTAVPVATTPPPVTTAPPPITTAPPPATTAPPVTTAPPPTGVWPAGRDGWTIVLVSLPESGGRAAAETRAGRARAAGLEGAGVLRSSDFASLNPGYYVVFAGVFDSLDAALEALPGARSAFPTAYTRRVSG